VNLSITHKSRKTVAILRPITHPQLVDIQSTAEIMFQPRFLPGVQPYSQTQTRRQDGQQMDIRTSTILSRDGYSLDSSSHVQTQQRPNQSISFPNSVTGSFSSQQVALFA
jgi:hypothetical protein